MTQGMNAMHAQGMHGFPPPLRGGSAAPTPRR
jgi:hypothetical protein